MDSSSIINTAVGIAGLKDYIGKYAELGGGELNDTFLLECRDRTVILRVARYSDQTSLAEEAASLQNIELPGVPRLIFFDKHRPIDGRYWILEAYMRGDHIDRLTPESFRDLGKLLARIHLSTSKKQELDIWGNFLKRRKRYVNEDDAYNHHDKRLRSIFGSVRELVKAFQLQSKEGDCSIIHADATPTNILVNDSGISLIDWEFSHRNDPMAEFSTIYYEDMEYNQGKWRVKIKPEEKAALFNGYQMAGGIIDEDRIRLWMNVDKLGAALYLYWRIRQSGRPMDDEQRVLYECELEKLILSLERHMV